LGTVALAYNATVHTTTGYSPHELFYSFAPYCPLDAVVSTPASDPASNADEFALQNFERLQKATAFVCEYTDKNIQHMKKHYDGALRPQSYGIGEKVLVYNPKKHRGKFAKWQIRWVGPFVVENKLNEANYVVKKGRGKLVVIHIDRLHKLPAEVDADNTGRPVSDSRPTSQPDKRRRADNAATATSTHCTETASCTDAELSRPITRSVNHRGQDSNVRVDRPGLGIRAHIPSSPQSTDTTVTEPAASADKPRLPSAGRPARARRRPA